MRVMEQKKDAPTPSTVTIARVLSRELLTSLRKRKGSAPIMVVPVVTSRTGIRLLRAQYSGMAIPEAARHNSPALITEALTVKPLTATSAQAAAALTEAPERVRINIGSASEGGIAERMISGRTNDSSTAAIIM